MVAAFATGEGPDWRAGVEEAMVCSSRVGRSLKISRSPDLSLHNLVKLNHLKGGKEVRMCVLWF